MTDQNQLLREALRVARDHIDMHSLEVSHCKDAALIRAAISQPAQPTPDPWREALQEECDLLHIPIPADAREAVKAVVAANVRIALNPDVSREAQALIDQGKAQASNPVA